MALACEPVDPAVKGRSAHRARRVVMGLAALAALVPALVLGASTGRANAGAATNTTAMPLQEFINDGAGGRLWNSYNETDAAKGPAVTGRPSALVYQSDDQVFTRSGSGDLIQYSKDDASGQTWNSYDLTTSSKGPGIAGDPVAVVDGSNLYVFARSDSGDLVEYVNDGSGAQLWSTIDISGAPGIDGDPSALVVGPTLYAFAQAANGDLEQYAGTGTGQRSWSATDLSKVSAGPALSGSPGSVLYGQSSIHVYGFSASGHLTEFVNDGSYGRAWNAYDLTTIAAGSSASGQPAAIVYGPTVHVYVNASGHLTEFVNDGANHRLWNSYDLTTISDSPAITGDATAIFYTPTIVDLFAQGPGGHLITYVNDGSGGRLWNSYDLTSLASGPTIGADPTALVNGTTVSVFAAGPSTPQAVNQIVSMAQSQDQNNEAVVENPPGSNCNIYSGYWGRGTTAGCAPGTSAEEWCSDFAQWVWTNAGIDTTGINGWAFTWVSWG
ncbi:MAG: hypothetical protein ACRDVW_03300, partial [Acidimicrobiales bacterium]